MRNFPSFDDTHLFEGEKVRFHKRAQILVADLWACFEGEGYGFFRDIDQVTMFAGESSRSAALEASIIKTRLPHTTSIIFNGVLFVQPTSRNPDSKDGHY